MNEQPQSGQPIQLIINTPTPQSPNVPPIQKPKIESKKEDMISKKAMANELYDKVTAKKQQALIAIVGIVATIFTGIINIQLSAVVGLLVCGLIGLSMRKDIQLLKYFEEKYKIQPRKGLW